MLFLEKEVLLAGCAPVRIMETVSSQKKQHSDLYQTTSTGDLVVTKNIS